MRKRGRASGPFSTRGEAADNVGALASALAVAVARWRGAARRPFLLGIGGLPGSGKSTLAHALARRLRAQGAVVAVLSLDDFYLGRRERLALARDAHPQLRWRGVPGTHDVATLSFALDEFAAGRWPSRPRFDKGRDRRAGWHRPRHERADVMILEGWLVGVPSLPPTSLEAMVGRFERRHDRDGRFRAYVARALARDYAPLWRRLDRCIALLPPNVGAMGRWREQSERARRAAGATHAMSPREVREFVDRFERLARHACRAWPSTCDLTLRLRADRSVEPGAIARALLRPARAGSRAGIPRSGASRARR